eukprot:2614561-Amphidinium_carterae.1
MVNLLDGVLVRPEHPSQQAACLWHCLRKGSPTYPVVTGQPACDQQLHMSESYHCWSSSHELTSLKLSTEKTWSGKPWNEFLSVVLGSCFPRVRSLGASLPQDTLFFGQPIIELLETPPPHKVDIIVLINITTTGGHNYVPSNSCTARLLSAVVGDMSYQAATSRLRTSPVDATRVQTVREIYNCNQN